MRDFIVKKGVRGYVVNIGCQVAGFSNTQDLIEALTEYIKNPEETEKKYYGLVLPDGPTSPPDNDNCSSTRQFLGSPGIRDANRQ